ncbi:hypothetical protein G6N82_06115 [Altererythrobacter sp. BO-6]|uniref:hypothetical protein n=1 Tax=Altererythrobacter sp. BO-6 TaxID=2604537 RepID=UPI0013E1A0B5|nr:hypothetical protein [Altererythrobacter sp. BO-6]QIG53786.1 hypothetical protein G6N82_06115 [Altererythrobacter sp. BO-6]
MLKLTTTAAIEAAIPTVTCPTLKHLMLGRLEDIVICDLAALTHLLVMEPQDTEAELRACLGREPRDWDWREQHGHWWELMYLASGGFAFIVLTEEPAFVQQGCEGAGR